MDFLNINFAASKQKWVPLDIETKRRSRSHGRVNPRESRRGGKDDKGEACCKKKYMSKSFATPKLQTSHHVLSQVGSVVRL